MIKCVNKPTKFKNLTLDKDYNVVREDGDSYFITNDIGIESKYAKRYFMPIPVVLPDITDEIECYVEDDENISITVLGNDCNLNLLSLNCCGLKEIDGLDELFSFINANIHRFSGYSNGRIEDVFKICIDKLLEYLRNNARTGFYIFTLSHIQQGFGFMDSILRRYTDNVHTTHNNSSGHDITVYLIS